MGEGRQSDVAVGAQRSNSTSAASAAAEPAPSMSLGPWVVARGMSLSGRAVAVRRCRRRSRRRRRAPRRWLRRAGPPRGQGRRGPRRTKPQGVAPGLGEPRGAGSRTRSPNVSRWDGQRSTRRGDNRSAPPSSRATGPAPSCRVPSRGAGRAATSHRKGWRLRRARSPEPTYRASAGPAALAGGWRSSRPWRQRARGRTPPATVEAVAGGADQGAASWLCMTMARTVPVPTNAGQAHRRTPGARRLTTGPKAVVPEAVPLGSCGSLTDIQSAPEPSGAGATGVAVTSHVPGGKSGIRVVTAMGTLPGTTSSTVARAVNVWLWPGVGCPRRRPLKCTRTE